MQKKYIALDLELICNESGIEKQKGGVIEIGACVFDKRGVILDEFSSFVQPINKRKVNQYTKNLLGITEQDFQDAPEFKEASKTLANWLSQYDKDIDMWMSWGDVDYHKIRESYQLANINVPHSLNKVFYDAQIGYQRKTFTFNRIGLNRALENEGIIHSLGTHRALDDAKKIPLLINYCL